jgi:hypothetical protein
MLRMSLVYHGILAKADRATANQQTTLSSEPSAARLQGLTPSLHEDVSVLKHRATLELQELQDNSHIARVSGAHLNPALLQLGTSIWQSWRDEQVYELRRR